METGLGSLMELAGGTEETPVEIGELETTEREIPEAPVETPAEVQAPAVQDVDAEIDLNAMFTEQLAEDTPQAEPAAAEAEPALDLGAIAEPAAAEAEPVLDLGAIAEPAAAEAEPVLDLGAMTEPAAAAQDNDVLELVELDEMPPVNAAPAEELEIVDPEQQPPPVTDGDDDDLKSFLNNFK